MTDDVRDQLRSLGEVFERQAPPVHIEELTARRLAAVADNDTRTTQAAPVRRRWLAARWVGAAAVLVVAAGVAAVLVAALRSGPTPTGPTSGGDPTPSVSVGPGPAPSSPKATDRVAGLFAPSSVPVGFSVVEATTWRGPEPAVQPQVSAETWISRDGTGAITGLVRLSASEQPPPLPNLVPLDSGGLTVHGEPAQMIGMGARATGSGISWDEQGLTLFVTSWGSEAASIAERTIVTAAAGITLPDGVLPGEFSRVDAQPNPSLAEELSSSLEFATSDGTRLSLLARANVGGQTLDSLVPAPGSQRRNVGDRELWLSTSEGGSAVALWIQGDFIVSAGAGGDVDEATLLAFVSSVQPASTAAFDRFVVGASAVDEALVEYDRATFADGLTISLRSISDINTPEVSSFGRRALCVTGDRTLCTGARPATKDGLLSTATSTRTIGQARELVVWTRSDRLVTRVFDADTDVNLSFETAVGTAGSFVRVRLPPELTAIDVRYEVAAEPGLGGAEQVQLGALDELANVDPPAPPPGG